MAGLEGGDATGDPKKNMRSGHGFTGPSIERADDEVKYISKRMRSRVRRAVESDSGDRPGMGGQPCIAIT